jgi:hypothetical protein
MHAFNSPFVVPVAIFAMIAILGVSGMISSYHEKKLKVEQRMMALQRGIPLEEIEKIFGAAERAEQERGDPLRSMRNARRAALILVACGVGIIATCLLLTAILQVREILAGAAGGLIPAAIGIGFWIDYKIQAREMERLGLVVGSE